MAEEFDLLAAKVLSGEATANEVTRFEEMLSADANLRAEFAELRATWSRLKELATLVQALDAPPAEPPPEKRKQWLARVERKFSVGAGQGRRFAPVALALAAVVIAGAIIGVLALRDANPRVSSFHVAGLTNSGSSALRTALQEPPDKLRGLLLTTRDGTSIPIYAPVGFTTEVTPTIMWKAAPGRTYNLAITDELAPASAPFRFADAVSPVVFTNAWLGRSLSRDGLYRLRISETGKPLTATELTVRVLAKGKENIPADPAAKLNVAYEMLAANPARIGDALSILLALSPELAKSEQALRLKLFAFGQLGYQEDFNAAFAQLEAAK